ncbi:ESX-1 secretion-associated protein [Mycolicibacterium neoaurum]|uniref:ESX-1 secretion-associated protein n=1 Tax=Mycolicibacterium neoaurum TaxID=1795 RepID=UPI003AB99AB4
MTTDHEKNLTVLTDHVRTLAKAQDAAVDLFTGANRSALGLADRLWSTHGIICAPMNMVMGLADTARHDAGLQLVKVSNDLSSRLRDAASNYDSTDAAKAGDLGSCQF